MIKKYTTLHNFWSCRFDKNNGVVSYNRIIMLQAIGAEISACLIIMLQAIGAEISAGHNLICCRPSGPRFRLAGFYNLIIMLQAIGAEISACRVCYNLIIMLQAVGAEISAGHLL